MSTPPTQTPPPSALEATGTASPRDERAALGTPEAVEASETEGEAIEASKAVEASETAATGH
eukprot:3419986-Heterocapsa_arctica.AAC.1